MSFILTSINSWSGAAQHPVGDARCPDKTGFLILDKVMVLYSFKHVVIADSNKKNIVLNSRLRTER